LRNAEQITVEKMKALKIAGLPALLLKGRSRIVVVADLHIGIGGYVDTNLVNSLIKLCKILI